MTFAKAVFFRGLNSEKYKVETVPRPLLCGAINSLVFTKSLQVGNFTDFMRRSFNQWLRIFPNWAQSKVEKTVEGSLFLFSLPHRADDENFLE